MHNWWDCNLMRLCFMRNLEWKQGYVHSMKYRFTHCLFSNRSQWTNVQGVHHYIFCGSRNLECVYIYIYRVYTYMWFGHSVVPNSWRELEPTGFLCLWDFPADSSPLSHQRSTYYSLIFLMLSSQVTYIPRRLHRKSKAFDLHINVSKK